VGSIRGEYGSSLKISLRGQKPGLWFDFATEEKGDALSLVEAVQRVSETEARNWALRWLKSIPSSAIGSPPLKDGSNDAAKHERALAIWHDAVPTSPRSPATTYLTSRGIKNTRPDSIRCNPSLRHKSGEHYPALVASVQNVDGEIIGIHRTFLAKDGKNKAASKPDKMMLGSTSGGAVRLAPAETKVAICEGIETGLSVMEAIPDLPVWAALSTSGMSAIQLPASVTEVIILADGDEPGETAALRLAKRLSAEGRKVQIARPPKGQDFNDLLLENSDEP
jgi:phage/plasmid primase-like uncharacterized protein